MDQDSIQESAMKRRFTVSDIASASCIARSSQENIQKVEENLRKVSPDLHVTDGTIASGENQQKIQTMRELALEHKRTVLPGEVMTDEDAWQWANADLVFGGFSPV